MGFELRKEASKYQPLFDLMHEEYNLILTRSEMDDIIKKAQEVVKENELLHSVSGCFWCDAPLKVGDKLEVLPEDRGVAHEKCVEEFYGSKMAEDE